MRFPRITLLSVSLVLLALHAVGQSPNGNINGLVLDPTNRVIAGAEIVAVNDVTGIQFTTKSNDEGIYVLPNLPPGPYRLQVSKVGFKTIIKPDIVLNVQDALSINFTLPIGALLETVTVTGGAPLVNTENATVSTVVDRQFAENLPLNGRSFQTLIELTPGIVVTAPSVFDGGQFSVNGQRTSSNYWMVDGVSANFGVGTIPPPGNGSAGALPAFSVLGGTNSLVSVDALQEFRVQTSAYAPEFGRTPGGQISIVTRSGTNQFHGTAFDYLRNDAFDASDWFNGYTNNPPLPKARERQNDFGGTLGGPVLKDRMFFFFSYEGLRLRLPQTTLTQVPDFAARQDADPALQPYLNAFPLDSSQPNLGNGIAQFNASYSDPATLDAYSLRVDDKLSGKVSVFGRYSYSPSQIDSRGGGSSLSTVSPSRITTQTITAGATWTMSTMVANDFRVNYSRTNSRSSSFLDNFGGAVPLQSLPFPQPFTIQDGAFNFNIGSLLNGSMSAGLGARNLQRQINVVDNLEIQRGRHSLKFGIDFRRLSPFYNPQQYFQEVFFDTVPAAGAGNLDFSFLTSGRTSTLLFRNLGVFAQDTWKIVPRLTMTYGVRWDVDFAPSSISGPSLLAVTGYNLDDLSGLALAPAGTPPFKTAYSNFAPRIGMAYEISPKQNWQTVFRGGFGVFYDLASSQVGNAFGNTLSYPFYGFAFNSGGTFPLDSNTAAPPPILPSSLNDGLSTLFAANPRLKLPYTLEWNVAFQQGLGREQTLSASYIGSIGRRLIQSASLSNASPNFPFIVIVDNTAVSDYNALQLQFQRRLLDGLQALASYSWSHSLDTGSAGSYQSGTNVVVPHQLRDANRGPSDFDIRNALSVGLTYEIPTPRLNPIAKAILRGWSTENFLVARSALPETIFYQFEFTSLNGANVRIRPDVVPGESFYLYGGQYPGGKAFNPAAFTAPPIDPTTNQPLRQGNLGRNKLLAFGLTQWDFAVHRDFPIHDRVKLQFRAEMFNLLNHPNFGPPSPALDLPNFGIANKMLGQSLGGLVGSGSLDPLYQLGGPRSVQFALKLSF